MTIVYAIATGYAVASGSLLFVVNPSHIENDPPNIHVLHHIKMYFTRLLIHLLKYRLKRVDICTRLVFSKNSPKLIKLRPRKR